MGGAPYRSKGCNTCRRRKVKCDETKPECLRCIKNGHACAGYERNRVFIHNSAETRTVVRRPRESTRGKGARAPDTDPDIPRFDVNAGIRTQFVANFLDLFTPSTKVRDGKDQASIHLQDTFPEFIGGSVVLDKAVTALGSAFLAKRQQDYHLLQYSTRLYGEALQIVHNRIRMGRKCGQDSLFATVIFQLYELINCSPLGFRGWLAHIQGSNAILAQYESPGPPSMMEHLFRRQLKFVTICDAVGMRKSAYSYSSFWQNPPKNEPWREPVDGILDALIECSAVMEQVDYLLQQGNSDSEHDKQAGEQLLGSCLSLRDRLDAGFCEMQRRLGTPWSSSSQPPFWSTLDPSIPQYLFPDTIEYPSLTCADSHLLYWTTFILLYPLIDQLLQFLERSHRDVSFTLFSVPSSAPRDGSPGAWNTDLSDDLLAVADHYANHICRSAKYLVQPETKAMGAQLLLAPFSQATQFYHSQAAIDKHRWCQAVFMLLPQLGFGIAPFLKDMIWPRYEASTPKKLPSLEVEAG